MSGVLGKKNSTLKKEGVKESKLLSTGVKSIKFWHEATAGETNIPFGSLNMPADVAVNGFSNPTSTELLSANLALFHTNVEVHSSLNQKLMEGLTYIVRNNQIKFVNNYTATEGEIFVVTYKNDTITGTNVVDARPLTATGVLTANTQDFNVGESFKTNAYPNDQIGEVMVFLDGEIQYRNTANAAAGPSADGNYQEVHAGNGMGVIIRFNETYIEDKPVIILSRNLIAERPDVSMMQLIENLGGQLDAVISTVAALAGVDETEFQTAPNQIDLKAFGNQVLANKQGVALNLETINKILAMEIYADFQELRVSQRTDQMLDRNLELQMNLAANLNIYKDTTVDGFELVNDAPNTRTKIQINRSGVYTIDVTFYGPASYIATLGLNGTDYLAVGTQDVNTTNKHVTFTGFLAKDDYVTFGLTDGVADTSLSWISGATSASQGCWVRVTGEYKKKISELI